MARWEAKSQSISDGRLAAERFSTSATAASPLARSRPTITRSAPMAANFTQASRPMPEVAPVTRTVLPFRSAMSRILAVHSGFGPHRELFGCVRKPLFDGLDDRSHAGGSLHVRMHHEP